MSVAPGSWHCDWYVTLHNTKRQNTELQIGSTQKQYWFPNPVGVQLALRMSASAEVHVPSLRGCHDKSRTGGLEERNHFTTFNNSVSETHLICLGDEKLLLLLLDLIKMF